MCVCVDMSSDNLLHACQHYCQQLRTEKPVFCTNKKELDALIMG